MEQSFAYICDWWSIVYWIVAFFCGCITATAELLSRYSDGPGRIFRFKESYFYLILNGLISLVAYAIVQKHGVTFVSIDNSTIGKAVFAGLFAMAVLRSSFASLRSGQKTIQVGFAPIMQVFLDNVDRAFDRSRSEMEIKEVGQIMEHIDFTKAAKDLPQTCLNLMQNVSKEEAEKLGREVADINKTVSSPQIKSVNLGSAISRLTGAKLLKAAVETLGDAIRYFPSNQGVTHQLPSDGQENKIKELKKKFQN